MFSVEEKARYEYLLYENFEKTKLLKIEEQKIVQKLNMFRFEINQIICMMKQMLDTIVILVNNKYIIQIAQIFSIIRSPMSPEEIHLFKNYSLQTGDAYQYRIIDSCTNDDVSVKDILFGAKKGVITLRHTYNLNVSTFSKGVLRFKQNKNDRSRASDCLQTDDLVSLAEMSFSIFNWYDSGLLFLREAIDTLKSHSTNTEYKPPTNLAILLDGLKSKYVDFHNSLFLKKNTHIGSDWKLLPFFVDKGFFFNRITTFKCRF